MEGCFFRLYEARFERQPHKERLLRCHMPLRKFLLFVELYVGHTSIYYHTPYGLWSASNSARVAAGSRAERSAEPTIRFETPSAMRRRALSSETPPSTCILTSGCRRWSTRTFSRTRRSKGCPCRPIRAIPIHCTYSLSPMLCSISARSLLRLSATPKETKSP